MDHNAGTQRHFLKHADVDCHKCKEWVSWLQSRILGDYNVRASNPSMFGKDVSKLNAEASKYVTGAPA